MLVGMKFADAPTNTYSTAQLQADLAAGVGKIVAGTGSNYRLNADPANGAITIGHVGAVYNGAAAAGGGVRPILGITAAGLAMGYNDNAGAWHNSVAIDASGTASFSGAINAESGNFTGTITVGSVIAGGVTVNGTSLLTIQNGAAAGATAVQPAAIANFITAAALTNLIDRTAATTLTGTIAPASGTANKGAFKIGSITWDVSGIVTGGSGIAITANGIVGAKNGLTSFSVDTNGNAYFKGDITGSNGAFTGTISAANLTAGTITASVSLNSNGSVNATGLYGSSLGNVSIVGAPSGVGHGVAGIASGGIGNTGVYGRGTGADYGVYSSGKIGTDNSSLVTNLNAHYLGGNLASAFLLATGTAADSSKLGGQLANTFVQLSGGLAGGLPSGTAYTLSLKTIGGATVRVPCYYP